MLHGFGRLIAGTTGKFLNPFSGLGKVIFFLSLLASLWFFNSSFYVLFTYSIILSLAVAFIVTFIFEFIYNLIRNKSSLR